MSRFSHEFKDLSRMVVGHHARRQNGPAPLRNLTLSLTYRCNARCIMCDIWENPTRVSEEISLEVVHDLATSRFTRNLVSLSLTGGEPLLREDLGEVAGIFSRSIPGCYVSTVTNGLTPALTMRRVEEMLASTSNELWVNVSIDSLDESYNAIRGIPGGEKKVMETTEQLVEMTKSEPRLNVGILYTLMPENVRQALPVLKYANKLDVQFTLNVINSGDVFYQQSPDSTLEWYRENRERLMGLFEDLRKEGYNRLLTNKLMEFFPQYLEEKPHRPVTCVSGFTSAFISPFGDVYPCVPSSEDYRMGNLCDSSFDEVWTSERAREVREAVNRHECNCLLTCETTNSLKFSPGFFVERVKDRLMGGR